MHAVADRLRMVALVLVLGVAQSCGFNCDDPPPLSIRDLPGGLKDYVDGPFLENEYWLFTNEMGDSLILQAEEDYEEEYQQNRRADCWGDEEVSDYTGNRVMTIERKPQKDSQRTSVGQWRFLVGNGSVNNPVIISGLTDGLGPSLEWSIERDSFISDGWQYRKQFMIDDSVFSQVLVPKYPKTRASFHFFLSKEQGLVGFCSSIFQDTLIINKKY
jgi:hypothetical protein